MVNTTIRTIPLAVREREVFVDVPALRTKLGAGEEPSDEYYVTVVPSPFVLTCSKEHSPCGIQNALSQLGFRKAPSVQGFKTEREKTAKQRETEFVREVRTFVGNVLLNCCKASVSRYA